PPAGAADLHAGAGLLLPGAGGRDRAGNPRLALPQALGPVAVHLRARPPDCRRLGCSPARPTSLCYRSFRAALATKRGLLRSWPRALAQVWISGTPRLRLGTAPVRIALLLP